MTCHCEECQRFQSRENTKNNLKLSSPAHTATYAVKTPCCFSSKKIPAEELKSVRLRSCFLVPGASEVYRDAMIQLLR